MRPLATLLALILTAIGGPARAADRIVSLNLCTDQMLVLLAPERIAALSTLARDPTLSFVAEQAERFPTVRASAEAVLRLRPDLVLGTRFGARTTLALLEKQGVEVVRTDLPQDFPAIRDWIRLLAERLRQVERGEALIAAMDAELVGPVGQTAPPPNAVAMQPRGYTSGPGSLMDAVLRAAGLANASDGRRMSAETLLRRPPDILVLPVAPAHPSLATAMLRTPAFAAIPTRYYRPAWTICAGPFTGRAVEALRR